MEKKREKINQLNTQFFKLAYEKDLLQKKYEKIINSRSLKFIIIPLRKSEALLKFFINMIRDKMNIIKDLPFKIIHKVRSLPLISKIANKLREKYPKIWHNFRSVFQSSDDYEFIKSPLFQNFEDQATIDIEENYYEFFLSEINNKKTGEI